MDLTRTARLAGLMVAGAMILSACGGDAATQAPAATDAPATEAPATQAPATGDINIGVAFPNSDTFLSRVQDGMQVKADELGVKISPS